MKTWCIDFSGYCEIKAETNDEAKEIFWHLVENNKPLPCNLYGIISIEMEEMYD